MTSATQDGIAYPMRNYEQLLLNGAFGNFRTLMYNVSVDPFMGNYLDMVNNAKANPANGTSPNENYTREIMQLFSIGLIELQTRTARHCSTAPARRFRRTRSPISPRWRDCSRAGRIFPRPQCLRQ